MPLRLTAPRATRWMLLALFAVEFFLFDRFGAHRFTAIYPRWNDQVQYLSEAYTGFEYARAHGFGAGLWHTLTNPSAQGTLHDFFALFAFWFAGPSRSVALALNMLALIGWQAALWLALTRFGRTTPSTPPSPHASLIALAAAMLPLALRGPWDDIPGSAYDFRLDHLAMCALGLTSALGLLTAGFRSRAWSLVFGAAVGMTLLTRFLTGTYFIVILLGSSAWILCGEQKKLRAANLGLAALIAFALAGPIFWLNREWVWNYYWIGHYVGPESAIRNQHFGLRQSLDFVFGQFAHRHLGVFFGALAGTSTLAFACARGGDKYPGRVRDLWGFGALFLFAPAFILTLHQQKSEVVVGALAPGLIVALCALWLSLARPRASSPVPLLAAAGIVVAALAFFTARQLAPPPDVNTVASNRQVLAAADIVFRRSEAAKLPEIRVAVDYITDCLDAQVIRLICYERHRVWLNFNMTLPTGIAQPTEAEVMTRVAASDFVFLTETGPGGGFPFDEKLTALRPQLRAWCDAHLRAVDRLTVFGRTMVLYQRSEIPFP